MEGSISDWTTPDNVHIAADDASVTYYRNTIDTDPENFDELFEIDQLIQIPTHPTYRFKGSYSLDLAQMKVLRSAYRTVEDNAKLLPEGLC